jgi:ketosteroid isomerase-like protein
LIRLLSSQQLTMRAFFIVATVLLACFTATAAAGRVEDLTNQWINAGADVDARLALVADNTVWKVDMPGVEVSGTYRGKDEIGNLLTRWHSLMDFEEITNEIMTTSDTSGIAVTQTIAKGKWKRNGNYAEVQCAHVITWNIWTGLMESQTHYEMDSQSARIVFNTYFTDAQRYFVELLRAKTESQINKNDEWLALLSSDFTFTTANVIPDAASLTLDKNDMQELFKMSLGDSQWSTLNIDPDTKQKLEVFMVATYATARKIAEPSPCGKSNFKYRFLPQYEEHPNTIAVEYMLPGQSITALYSFNDSGQLVEEKIFLFHNNIIERFIRSDALLRTRAMTIGFESMYAWPDSSTN